MSSRGSKFLRVRDFSKGLVTNQSPGSLASGEAQEAINVDLSRGTIQRRNGWAKLHTSTLEQSGEQSEDEELSIPSSTNPITALYSFYPSSGSNKLFAVGGTVLMSSEGGDFTAIDTNLAPYGPVYATFKTTQEAVYIGTRYGSGAGTSQTLKKWTSGGGLVTLSSGANNDPPEAWMVTSFSETLVAMGADGTNRSRVYWSRIFPNQDTWPTANFTDLLPGDGDKITGVGRIINALVVFKERSIHRIVGTLPDDTAIEAGDFAVTTYEDQAGCIAPRSVASRTDFIVYLNRSGIYAYDGIRTRELTKNIRDIFLELNESELKNAVGFLLTPEHYVLSVTTEDATSPDLVISLRFSPQSIVLWRGLEAHSWENFVFSGTTVPVIGTRGNAGRLDADADDDEFIPWSYATGILDTGDDPYNKTVRRGWLWVTPTAGSIKVELLPNFGTTGPETNLDLGMFKTRREGGLRLQLPAFGTARNWAVRVSGTGTGPAPEIQEIVLETYPTHVGG